MVQVCNACSRVIMKRRSSFDPDFRQMCRTVLEDQSCCQSNRYFSRMVSWLWALLKYSFIGRIHPSSGMPTKKASSTKRAQIKATYANKCPKCHDWMTFLTWLTNTAVNAMLIPFLGHGADTIAISMYGEKSFRFQVWIWFVLLQKRTIADGYFVVI